MNKKSLFFTVFLSLSSLFFPLFASTISSYTEQKIDEFLYLEMRIPDFDTSQEALSAINSFAAKATDELFSNAIDFEQEQLILDSLYAMKRYDCLLDPSKNRKELRAMVKAQMKKNREWLSLHEKEGKASKWIYLLTGDVMSYYMTRSVGATIRYGLDVKKLYEKALELDETFTFANINLGNWLFYAPKMFGGGIDKAGTRYGKALDGARNEAERYKSNLSLSQYWFVKKDMELCNKYLAQAETENPGSEQIATVRKLNEFGASLFDYKRNQCGIDEKMDEKEMDEDDK